MARETTRKREEALHRAALRVFRHKGYHYASIRDIAKEAGIQTGSIYYYVNSKEDLLEGALNSDMEEMTLLTQQTVGRDHCPMDKLREALCVYVEYIVEHMDALGVLMQDWHSLSPEARGKIVEKRDGYEAVFRQILQDAIASGDFREVDVSLVTFAIFGMCNYLFAWYRPDGRRSAREIAEVFADLLLDGLTASVTREDGRQEHRSRLAIARKVHSLRDALQSFNDVQFQALSDIESELKVSGD